MLTAITINAKAPTIGFLSLFFNRILHNVYVTNLKRGFFDRFKSKLREIITKDETVFLVSEEKNSLSGFDIFVLSYDYKKVYLGGMLYLRNIQKEEKEDINFFDNDTS